MKKLLTGLALIFLCLGAAHAEMPKEKRAEIEKLLRLTGMEKLMTQMKVNMIASLKTSMTDVPADFWERFQKKMDMHELIDKIIPLYDKYYSLDDLKAANAFYASPAGQKILSTTPALMQESMNVGREWGEKIGREAAEEARGETKTKS